MIIPFITYDPFAYPGWILEDIRITDLFWFEIDLFVKVRIGIDKPSKEKANI